MKMNVFDEASESKETYGMSETSSIYPQSLIQEVREVSEQLQNFQEKYKDVFTPTSDTRISDMVTDCAVVVNMMLKEVERPYEKI